LTQQALDRPANERFYENKHIKATAEFLNFSKYLLGDHISSDR